MAVQFTEPKTGGSLAKLMVASVMVHILESPFWLLGASWDDFPTGRKASLMIVGNVEASPCMTERWWRSKTQTAPSLEKKRWAGGSCLLSWSGPSKGYWPEGSRIQLLHLALA